MYVFIYIYIYVCVSVCVSCPPSLKPTFLVPALESKPRRLFSISAPTPPTSVRSRYASFPCSLLLFQPTPTFRSFTLPSQVFLFLFLFLILLHLLPAPPPPHHHHHDHDHHHDIALPWTSRVRLMQIWASIFLKLSCLSFTQKTLARDDCCIGGFSLAGPNRYCNPTTALLAFLPPPWPQVFPLNFRQTFRSRHWPSQSPGALAGRVPWL